MTNVIITTSANFSESDIELSGESYNVFDDYINLGETFHNIKSMEVKTAILNLIRVVGGNNSQYN